MGRAGLLGALGRLRSRDEQGAAQRRASEQVRAAFAILFGRDPTEAERERLRSLNALSDVEDTTRLMRRMVAATDRHAAPTDFLIRFGARDVAWTRQEGFEAAIDEADVSVGQYVLRRAWEPHIEALMRSALRLGMSVVDIGSNLGVHTLLAASLVGSEGRVHAFEPNSENNRLLLLSCERNGFANVTLHPTALSDREGYALFATNMGSNGGFTPQLTQQLLSAQCIVAPVATLDASVCERVDFIKIDVEGAEALALAGGERLVRRWRPTIVSEFSPLMLASVSGVSGLDYLRRMQAWGYSLHLLPREAPGGGTETPIPDPAAFLADYGSEHRIEDLVFRAAEPA